MRRGEFLLAEQHLRSSIARLTKRNPNPSEETHPEPRIVEADRLNSGVVITFDDGRCALYSASLLYANLDAAQDLTVDVEDE